jgi:hypothetical protein
MVSKIRKAEAMVFESWGAGSWEMNPEGQSPLRRKCMGLSLGSKNAKEMLGL